MGSVFGRNAERSDPPKCPIVYCIVNFEPSLGIVVPFYFWFYFECFQHKIRDVIFMLSCKDHRFIYNRIRSLMYLLPWSWDYNCIHNLENILNWFISLSEILYHLLVSALYWGIVGNTFLLKSVSGRSCFRKFWLHYGLSLATFVIIRYR